MQNMKPIRCSVLALLSLPLAGCGLFKSGTSNRLQPNDPNRIVAKMVANVSSITFFADADSGKTATFRGTIWDKDGNQFYGPKVQLDGKDVPPTTNEGSSTIYFAGTLDFAAGQTFTTTVQTHVATTPAAVPQLLITSPVKFVGPDASTPPKDVTFPYYKQPAQQGVTLTWTGGDPSQPVYIFIFGTPDANPARRLFVSDDPLKSPSDPENFGQPIANTGSYTIPTTLTERYVDKYGAIAMRNVNTFDDPVTTDTAGRPFNVYVVQRSTTVADPIRFSVLSSAYVTASVLPKT